MVAPNSEENVNIPIEFEITQAIANLDKLLSSIDSVTERTKLIGEFAVQTSDKYGVSINKVIGALEQLQAVQEKVYGSSPLTGAIPNLKLNEIQNSTDLNPLKNIDLSGLSKAMSGLDTFNEKVKFSEGLIKSLAKTFGVSFEEAASTLKSSGVVAGDTEKIVTTALKNVQDGTTGAGNAAESSAFKFNVLRTVLGTLVALGVFQALQFIFSIGQAFVEAAKDADQLTRAIVDLKNVEGILSFQGVKVSMKDLFDIVSQLQEKFHLISKTDLTDLVSQAAIATREFGFSLAQIKDISTVAAAIAETQDITSKQALDAVIRSLSGRSQGNQILKQSGIFLRENEIKQRAVTLGLAENTKAVSEAATAQAVLSLELEKSAGLLSEVGELEQSDAGKVAALKAQYENFLTDIGTGFYGIVANASEALNALVKFADDSVNGLKVLVIAFQASLYAAKEFFTGISGKTTLETIINFIRAVIDIFAGGGENAAKAFADNFTSYFTKSIPEFFKTPLIASGGNGKLVDFLNKYITAGDTATGTTKKLGNAFELTEEQTSKIGDILKNLAKDLQSLGERKVQIDVNYNQASARAAEDLLLKQRREFEDHLHDLAQLNQETNDKLADANRKYHAREVDEEAKFQEKLRELRERFLFDLEDALRERDAKQVLRLIRQYNLEKDQAIRQHELDKKDRAEQHAEEIADIQRQAAEKAAELEYEYQTRRAREIEDAKIAQQRRDEEYRQALQQLQQQIQDKLQATANALAEELGLNADGAKAIYNLLNQFYGPGGFFDGLYTYSYDSIIAKTAAFIQNLQNIANQAIANANAQVSSIPTTPTPSGSVGGGGTGGSAPAHPFAEGGLVIANKPTKAIFGERGAELALFVPLNKMASTFAGGGFLPGENDLLHPHSDTQSSRNRIEIDVSLDEGLEAKIVDRSIGSITEIVSSVNRKRK